MKRFNEWELFAQPGDVCLFTHYNDTTGEHEEMAVLCVDEVPGLQRYLVFNLTHRFSHLYSRQALGSLGTIPFHQMVDEAQFCIKDPHNPD